MRKIYSALDIGSSFIKLVVGEFFNNKLNILCAVKGETKGFRNNQITDSNKLIASINDVLNEASNILNFKITKLIVNIPTDYNDFKIAESKIPINNEEEIVTTQDIVKVLQNTSNNELKETEELLATLPIVFQVDDEETSYPLNKKGKNLFLKSVLVITDKKRVYDLAKVLEKCEVQIIDITTTGLVDYYNFKNKNFNNKNVIIVNIGATTTNISVFSKGIYINNICLDNGSFDIDKEIAAKYNLRKKEATYLKETLALASINRADIRETISLIDCDGKEIVVNQKELSDLVNKKIVDILKNIKKNINYLTKKEISYIIITGGLAEFKDLAIPINKIIPNAEIGYINDIGARDASFSVALGMLRYFNEKLALRGKNYSMLDNDELEYLTSSNVKLTNNDTILGKVFSYFFDN